MSLSSRRSLLKTILALPIVSSASEIFGQSQQGASPAAADSDYQQKFLAVRILRLINSAEATHGKTHKDECLDLSELNKCAAMNLILKSDKMEERGIGASLHSVLDFEANEIVPGWILSHYLRKDATGYLALMTPTSTRLPAFSTDEKGIIYEGRPLGSTVQDPQKLAARDAVLA